MVRVAGGGFGRRLAEELAHDLGVAVIHCCGESASPGTPSGLGLDGGLAHVADGGLMRRGDGDKEVAVAGVDGGLRLWWRGDDHEMWSCGGSELEWGRMSKLVSAMAAICSVALTHCDNTTQLDGRAQKYLHDEKNKMQRITGKV